MSGALALAAAALGVALVRSTLGFRRFRARIRAHLDATPDIRWQRSTRTGMLTAVSGYALELDLLPTYLHLRLRRPREQALLAELADALRRRVPPAPVPPLALVRDRLLPLIKRSRDLPPAGGYVPENTLARRPLDAELEIAYVVEGQFRMTYVTLGMLAAWGLAGEALHDQALANLRGKTAHLLEEIGGPRREYLALDGFDAARLLIADLLVPADVADPVFAIPHEHALLIAPDDRRAHLRESAEEAHRRASLPLSTALYRWTPAGPERLASPQDLA